jgi:hypothetical protein
MMPFEIVLKGERTTLENHLSYGYLTTSNPKEFSNLIKAASK